MRGVSEATRETVASDPISEAWTALRRHLESRSQALSEEIRHYPTPIARCDEQLTGLIALRAHAQRQLSAMDALQREARQRADGRSTRSLRAFLNAYGTSDDEAEMGIVARLRAAASGSRRIPS